MECNMLQAWKKTKKRLFLAIPFYLFYILYMLIKDYGDWDAIIFECFTLTAIFIALIVCMLIVYYISIKVKK